MTLGHELKKEHEIIERELIELDTVMNSPNMNYPNLLHVLRRLEAIWNEHEEKEEVFFQDLHQKGFTIPIKKITFEHGKLKRDMEIILHVLQKGTNDEIHDMLQKYGKDLTSKLRKHMSDEDWILYALPRKF